MFVYVRTVHLWTIHMNLLSNKLAVNVLRLPDREWYPQDESSNVIFIENDPAPSRSLIGQARYVSYINSITEGYEYVGWIDDDDFTNPYYFTKSIEILESNPHLDAIAARQATYLDDKPNEYKKLSGDIIPAKGIEYHGPCVYRSSSLIHGLDVLRNFVGIDENRYLANHMIKSGFNLGLWDSYETFLVRSYSKSKERIDNIIKQRAYYK